MDATGRARRALRRGRRHPRARNVPSPQLVGTPRAARRSTSTRSAPIGVELRGRLGAIRDGVALFSGGLRNQCALADLKLHRLLDTIDEWADWSTGSAPASRWTGRRADGGRRTRRSTLDLTSGEIRTIVWATGLQARLLVARRAGARPQGPAAPRRRRRRRARACTSSARTFLRRRRSSFIHGAGDDAEDLADHLATHLAG